MAYEKKPSHTASYERESWEARGMGEPERQPPDPNDSRLAGLDVFSRPASPGLQLLPWRESSLDGLGATSKVRGGWGGGQWSAVRTISCSRLHPQSPSTPSFSFCTLDCCPLPDSLSRIPSGFLHLLSLLTLSLPPSSLPLLLYHALPLTSSHLNPFYSLSLCPPGQPHQRHSAPQLQGLSSGQRQAF